MRSAEVQPPANIRQTVAIPRHLECDASIVGQSVSDELGQTDRTQQTAGHSRGKCCPGPRQYGAAPPERVADGCMAVVRKRIEEQIGQTVPSQMLRKRQSWREDESFGRDAVGYHFAK